MNLWWNLDLQSFFIRCGLVDITTSDYDDEEVEENIAYNCKANEVKVLPHVRRKFCSVIKHANDILLSSSSTHEFLFF
ncbi:hypothetical protein IEQ34_001074 [Dendrobium chrysotoxum]|uniref:Uncharacterized protein n=1 Tax=Dendrobium chrysotoxum TaxID=161865 RepID=A0AAV7HKC2_DENCH|nr:hypothetical protein IEQ34_001074 [Dendrobium chrysotoxum]